MSSFDHLNYKSIVKRRCRTCKKIFKTSTHILKIKWGKFCSLKCANIGKQNREKYRCKECRKAIWRTPSMSSSKSGYLFCGHYCSSKFNNHQRYSKPQWWKDKKSYRSKALRFLGVKCNRGKKCLLRSIKLPIFMYEVDHIDSNRRNNDLSNLQVLCVWCHRIKTYKYT